MQQASQHKPTTLNLDKHFKDLTPTESYYLLNHETLLNINGRIGSNSGKGKPLPANYQGCDIDQPAGENHTIGGYRSAITNEFYSWHYNTNNVHYVLRTSNNGCEIVYMGCLDLSAEPKYSIEQFRAFLWVEKLCSNRDGKQLIWVNGNSVIGQLDVEASIATNFFTTPFFDLCRDTCAYAQMCVPEICGCLVGQFVPLDPADAGLPNNILDQPFQFAIKHVYYDNRESEWSDRSTLYFQSTKGCFDSSAGFPRCIKLRVPVGNPMVDRIKIAFTTDGVNWYMSEIVEKYKKYNNSQEKWYERTLSEGVAASFSMSDCSFDYYFCNDKHRIPIDPVEMARVRNPVPRKPQGILPVKDSLGFYNYEDGVCPIDKKEIEKIQIILDCDTSNVDCSDEYVTVIVRAVVHDYIHSRNQFIWRAGGVAGSNGGPGSPDDIADPAHFGGIQFNHATETSYGQTFRDKTRNFIAYVEGTDYWAEMKQWVVKYGDYSTRKESGILQGMQSQGIRDGVMASTEKGTYRYQEAKIRVLKGTKGFIRLTSHEATNGQGANQDTSTFVNGIVNDIRNYRGNLSIPSMDSITDYTTREVYFDACSGDVELFPTFVISDNTEQALFTGYIEDANGLPVEGAIIGTQKQTDHNGFFHFGVPAGAVTAPINVELSCGAFSSVQNFTGDGTDAIENRQDVSITSLLYKDDFYLIVQAKVQSCQGVGVAGIRVAISGSKFRVTDSNGIATFRLRNYSGRNRQVRVVVMNNRGCFDQDCNYNCSPCMPTESLAAPSCFINKPTLVPAPLSVNIDSATSTDKGLKAGGRYPFGVVVQGDCGRQSAAYNLNYIDIPKTQAKNILGFCSFSYNGNGVTLPEWAKCLKIVRGANLNPFEFQWKIDKIEKTISGNIKLTIQSLNDYNQQFNFKTNTGYQWAADDRVEFIKNGDGTILTIAQYGLLNYQTISPFNDENISGQTDAPADFFNQLLILDDGRLDGITEGAIIEIQRPLKNTPETIYYEICATIPVRDGQLRYSAGQFSTFDTYFVNRTIGSFVGTFEHHSPSDFWGSHLSDKGKAHVANTYENERRYGRSISLNSPTQFNYFGTLVKTFNAPEQGDIIAMGIKDGKIISAICENDNFLAQSADELVRVGGDGIIRALPPDAIISEAEPKVYGAFGCKYDHVGSILFGDGYFTWTDVSKSARVVHDYSRARDVGEGKVQSYYRLRCQEIEAHNSITTDPLDKYRFATGYNNQNGIVYQTIKRLRDSAYNNDKRAMLSKNNTIMYHPIINEWFGFAGFTPEFYGNMDLNDDKGCAFLAFFNALVYIHPIISDRYNEFFGVPCDEIVGITLNKFPEKMKEGAAVEIQSDMPWFAYEITNGKSTFISEIPAVRWKRDNDKWNAGFLFNKNSRAGLYGNGGGVPEPTRGWFVNISLIRDNTDGLKYGTIDNTKRVKYNETDLMFVKFALVEQTGFDQNL